MKEAAEHTLEFLLAFDGRVHWYAEGYFVKFAIRPVRPTVERPHGGRYSLTLHAPDGMRLIGFDNAHGVPAVGSRFNKRHVTADHWHHSGDDPGQPYIFKDAASLIEDFLDEVRRVHESLSIAVDVVETGDEGGKDD
jgi:hypothetical protein